MASQCGEKQKHFMIGHKLFKFSSYKKCIFTRFYENECFFKSVFIFRDSTAATEETMDYIVAGSVDDAVKVWTFTDNGLEMKHKLEGHSLGVVSVAVSTDSTSMYFRNHYVCFVCVHL